MEILIARSKDEIDGACERLSKSPCIGCDTETSSLSPKSGRLYSIQFSDGGLSVLVPLSEGVSLGALSDLLSSDKITKIFHNAKFDLAFLQDGGYEVNNFYCTMTAEKVLTKGANQSVSLAETLYRYFAIDLDKSRRSIFAKNWDGIWSDELVNYALSDVVYLPKLMDEQIAWMKRLGLYEDFERRMKEIA